MWPASAFSVMEKPTPCGFLPSPQDVCTVGGVAFRCSLIHSASVSFRNRIYTPPKNVWTKSENTITRRMINVLWRRDDFIDNAENSPAPKMKSTKEASSQRKFLSRQPTGFEKGPFHLYFSFEGKSKGWDAERKEDVCKFLKLWGFSHGVDAHIVWSDKVGSSVSLSVHIAMLFIENVPFPPNKYHMPLLLPNWVCAS